jgi:hypothetical protein
VFQQADVCLFFNTFFSQPNPPMTIKELIAFLQAQPNDSRQVFVQNGLKAYPIAIAQKGYLFKPAQVVNNNSDPYFHDDWQVATGNVPPHAVDVLLLTDALDAPYSTPKAALK